MPSFCDKRIRIKLGFRLQGAFRASRLGTREAQVFLVITKTALGRTMSRRLPEELTTSRLRLRAPVAADAAVIFGSYTQDLRSVAS